MVVRDGDDLAVPAGLSDIDSGTHSVAEIALTVVIAVCSISGILGILSCVRAFRESPPWGAVVLVPVGFGLQASFLAAGFRLFD